MFPDAASRKPVELPQHLQLFAVKKGLEGLRLDVSHKNCSNFHSFSNHLQQYGVHESLQSVMASSANRRVVRVWPHLGPS
jgi:hypothetical protein